MKVLKIFLCVLFLIISTSIAFSWGDKKILKELTNSAPIIVFGKVLEVNYKTEKYLGQDNFIMTYAVFSAQNYFKGSSSEQVLIIKVPGGQIGDRVIAGERSFHFAVNEEALLFLSRMGNNLYEIYSISGKLPVINKNSDENYFDCSLLEEDEVSDYGYGSTVKVEAITNRIQNYLTERGGK